MARSSRATLTPGVDTDSVELGFDSRVIEWRGPSPYYFVPVPAEASADIREVAAVATYGWGVIPVEARIGGVSFETSLFPKDGGYLLPLKEAVRRPYGLMPGSDVTVELAIRVEG
jgi:Domain of unknown function (DUF1905)